MYKLYYSYYNSCYNKRGVLDVSKCHLNGHDIDVMVIIIRIA